ncbi:MAG TPA: hypothetical protein VFA85_13755 [Terriglobales bacterium]|nr:hypothetical protein [Terriglobales bacterium]
MQITGKRIFSAILLTGCTITVYQVMSKPQPIATRQNVEDAQASIASFDQKIEQLAKERAAQDTAAEVRFSSDEVSAEIARSTGAIPPTPVVNGAQPVSAARVTPNTVIAPGPVQVRGYQVKLDGDVARGQFVTEVAGKDVYVTLAGRLGSQDGYVTFDPTEFKVGDLDIPVSLVNSALQKKLAEQREQLKLPDWVASLRVENSELVITPKQ